MGIVTHALLKTGSFTGRTVVNNAYNCPDNTFFRKKTVFRHVYTQDRIHPAEKTIKAKKKGLAKEFRI